MCFRPFQFLGEKKGGTPILHHFWPTYCHFRWEKEKNFFARSAKKLIPENVFSSLCFHIGGGRV